MEKYKVKIKGTASLLQNKKVEMDTGVSKVAENRDSPDKCKGKLYIYGKKICQPAIMIEQALIKAATGIKMKGAGKKSFKELFKGNVFIKPENIPHKSQKWEVHQTTVVIPATKGRINRYRPMLKNWELNFTIEVLDDRIEKGVLKLALDEAGRTIGIGDWRPRFGRFIVTEFKEV